jgi:hypothetical protein
MSWKLSRVLNNGNKKNNRLFYSLGSVERSGVIGSLIPSGQGSLTLYQKNLSVGSGYLISASGTCNWNDYENLRIIVLDGINEIVSINIPLSQCISTWNFEFNIIVSGISDIITYGNFSYVRSGGTIFEGSNIGGKYTTNQDINIDVQAVLSNGRIICNEFLMIKKF